MHASDVTKQSEALPRNGSRAGAILRLLGFCACLLAASLAWLAHTASAELSERALSVGRELQRWAPPTGDAGTTLRVNGQVLTLTTASTQLPIAAVLDRFEALCARDSGGSAEELAKFAQQPGRLPAGFDVRRFGVLRSESEREGTAACFAREGKRGLAQLFGAALELAESGDLQAFGRLRYLFVRRSGSGNGNHVITVSSAGPLPLFEMWPASGDAPGRDLPEGVRPPEAARTLSAEADDGYALATYESARPPAEVLASYARQLSTQGYQRQTLALVPAEARAENTTQVFARGNDVLIVFATEQQSGGGSLVAAARITRRGYVAVSEEGG